MCFRNSTTFSITFVFISTLHFFFHFYGSVTLVISEVIDFTWVRWDQGPENDKISSTHPGGELSAGPHWSLSQSGTSIYESRMVPTFRAGTTRCVQNLLRLRPISSHRGPKKGALLIGANHIGPTSNRHKSVRLCPFIHKSVRLWL